MFCLRFDTEEANTTLSSSKYIMMALMGHMLKLNFKIGNKTETLSR